MHTALSWPEVLDVVDMHTGGEPVRIVRKLEGLAEGGDILAKRRHFAERHDDVRRLLMYEPRGHADMYGAVLVAPSLPGADLAVLFIHNEGYSTMCGHAVIALGRYAVDYGLVPASGPLTRVGIECPCGLVEAWVEIQDGRSGRVFFDSVPAFALALDVAVTLPEAGALTVDVGYGGAFYALAPAIALGVSLDGPVAALKAVASRLSEAVRQTLPIRHPLHEDLGFLYGSILSDGRERAADGASSNVCVFADAEVDRSPTGSGVTARMAVRYARGRVAVGERCVFRSLTGAEFSAEVRREVDLAGLPAVVVRVGGQAHYSGEARFWLEEGDEIGRGFLLR